MASSSTGRVPFQLDQSERGFSFQSDGPLDMRMARSGPSAADLVNELAEPELPRCCSSTVISRRPGPSRVPSSPPATRHRSRPPALGRDRGTRQGGRQGPRDPATRSFQALRIVVNDELGELERGLAAAEALLRPGGRLVVVSFHSGEDTQVKRFVNEHGGRQAQPSRHLPPVAMPAARWRWVRRA